jgi:hypothetical protein
VPISLPPLLADMLTRALELEEGEGTPESLARRDALRAHYLTLMPELRRRQRETEDPAHQRIFHSPLRLDAMPRLRRAAVALRGLLRDADVPDDVIPALPLLLTGAPTLSELADATYFAAQLPVLYTYPGDLDAYARELRDREAAGASPAEAITALLDLRLTAPIIHELCHFGPERQPLFPPLLDECVAGYLGVVACPSFSFPEGTDDNALLGAPWFAQVGQALARSLGILNLVRAQAGITPWPEAASSAFVDAAARCGWAQHRRCRAPSFLAENTRPEPWVKLAFLARNDAEILERQALATLEAVDDIAWSEIPTDAPAPLDLEILRDGIRAMCLAASSDGGAYRVRAATPTEIISIDLDRCVISRHPAEVPLDGAAPRYFFPPAVAAGAPRQPSNSHRPRRLALRIEDLGAIEEIAVYLFEHGPIPGSGPAWRLDDDSAIP